MWYMHGAGWGWWIVGTVGMVAVWAAIIYLVVWLVRGAPPRRGEDRRGPADETPQQILKRRLAAGEISVDEYERLRAAIDGEKGSSAPPDRKAA